MAELVHLDANFLILALTRRPELRRLERLASSDAVIRMSAVAWYEFCRGPRTASQVAAARSFLAADGVVPFSEDVAEVAAAVFRSLGSPRKRSADIAIGVTAVACGASLATHNEADFSDLPGLRFYS